MPVEHMEIIQTEKEDAMMIKEFRERIDFNMGRVRSLELLP